MPTLRQLQAEFNALVPVARAAGINARPITTVHESIRVGVARVAALRSRIASTTTLTPVSGDLTFGVEMEFLSSVSAFEVAAALTRAGVETRAEGYNHFISRHWKIVTDGSVTGTMMSGLELVSPVLSGAEGFCQLQLACATLSGMTTVKINKTCGLHVHIGARSEGLDFFKNLVRLYASAQPTINTLVAPSRFNHTFVRQLRVDNYALGRATNMEQLASAVHQTAHSPRAASRYVTLNLQNYWGHGTVEFRQHQGSVDPVKVAAWVRFCQGLCLAARAGANAASDLPTLMDVVAASAADRAYFGSRQAHFAVRRAA